MSFFLFGARGVGKTWLVRELFRDEPHLTTLDLLSETLYFELLANAGRLRDFLLKGHAPQWIFIDEVQRVPGLLSAVHQILESPEYHERVRFVLTGSSARKLKRGGADLLAGRALVYRLFPLSVFETGDDWGLEHALAWGSLPKVVTAASDQLRTEILEAYVGAYLREEIKEEQIVRQIEPFVRFLEAAAQANGTIIQYANIAKASLVDAKAVSRYFEILEDTLLGFFLEPFSRSARERTTAKAKFYFFDTGVQRALDRALSSPLRPGTYAWGKAFEHYFILECLRLDEYRRVRAKFSYLRTKDEAEIDLILEKPGRKPLCIEIKAGETVSDKEIRKLKKISQAVPQGDPIMVFNGPREMVVDDVRIVPWKKALGEFFDLP